jgi:hypothetical protein
MIKQFLKTRPWAMALFCLLSTLISCNIFAAWGYHNGGGGYRNDGYRNDGYRNNDGQRSNDSQRDGYNEESAQSVGYHNGSVQGQSYQGYHAGSYHNGWAYGGAFRRGWYGWRGFYYPFMFMDGPFYYFPFYPYTITYNYPGSSDSYYYDPILDRYEPVSAPLEITGRPNDIPTVVATAPASVSSTAETSSGTITINIPDSKGGFTPVVLKKYKDGYLGPQNEYYQGNPTVAQLKLLYGK